MNNKVHAQKCPISIGLIFIIKIFISPTKRNTSSLNDNVLNSCELKSVFVFLVNIFLCELSLCTLCVCGGGGVLQMSIFWQYLHFYKHVTCSDNEQLLSIL